MFEHMTGLARRMRQKISLRFPFLVPKKRDGIYAYLLTIALMGLALFTRLAIAPLSAGVQYITFFPAVTLSAIFGGYRSGLLATAIGLVLATFIFTPPYYSFSMEALHFSFWSNAVFLVDGIIVSYSIEAMHRFRLQFKNELGEVKKSEVLMMKLNEELAEQEAFFRLIAENVEDFIAVLDRKGRRIYNSPSYARLFGDVNAMKGTDSFAEIHPDDRERVRQVFSDALQRGIGLRTEYRLLLPNGGICHMESSSGLIKNSRDEPQSVVVVSHDVTERKQNEDQRRKADASLRLMVESVTDCSIIMLDTEGRIENWNIAAQRIKGYSEMEIVGQHFSIFYPHEDIECGKPQRDLDAAIAEGRFEDEGWRVRKDGSAFWANVVITTMRDAGGKLCGFVKLTRDFTERRRMKQMLDDKNLKLENARVVAEKANLAKSDFISSMSHELRTPLNAILGFSQLLETSSPPLTAIQTIRIEQIHKAGWYLLELINEILDLAVIESGKLTLSPEPLSLAKIMLECQTMTEPQAQIRDIKLTFP